MKKNIVIIPARAGSTGIVDKNIINIANKPLIVWSIEQAMNSRCIDEVFVTTDSHKIAEISKFAGAKIIDRPKELATNYSSSEEALLHAIDVIEKSYKIEINLVVFLQATSPIREKRDIDNAIKLLVENNYDSLFSSYEVKDHFLWEYKHSTLNNLTYDYRNRNRRQDIKSKFLENGSIYIFTPKLIKETNNRLGGKISTYPMERWKSFQIDKPEDVEICEYFLNRKIKNDREIS